MVRRCWVNFQCRGVLLIWIIVGQGPIALAVGAGGGCLDIFTLLYRFSSLSPSLWETARYRLKYCLKGPLNPKQPTNPQISSKLLLEGVCLLVITGFVTVVLNVFCDLFNDVYLYVTCSVHFNPKSAFKVCVTFWDIWFILSVPDSTRRSRSPTSLIRATSNIEFLD